MTVRAGMVWAVTAAVCVAVPFVMWAAVFRCDWYAASLLGATWCAGGLAGQTATYWQCRKAHAEGMRRVDALLLEAQQLIDDAKRDLPVTTWEA